jgi:hypothetical protein
MRTALFQTIDGVIELYVGSANQVKDGKRRGAKKSQTEGDLV